MHRFVDKVEPVRWSEGGKSNVRRKDFEIGAKVMDYNATAAYNKV